MAVIAPRTEWNSQPEPGCHCHKNRLEFTSRLGLSPELCDDVMHAGGMLLCVTMVTCLLVVFVTSGSDKQFTLHTRLSLSLWLTPVPNPGGIKPIILLTYICRFLVTHMARTVSTLTYQAKSHIAVTLESLCGVMVNTLAPNARNVGSIPALSAIFLIVITLMTLG